MRVRFIVYYENSYEKHFERPRVADSGITLYPYSDLRTVGVDTTSACQVIENDKLMFVPFITKRYYKNVTGKRHGSGHVHQWDHRGAEGRHFQAFHSDSRHSQRLRVGQEDIGEAV